MYRIVMMCTVAIGATMWATDLAAVPMSRTAATRAAAANVGVVELAQFLHQGQPYCWYPYGWAGAGWYWCGYGTRDGLGWGGGHGWNNWVVPRPYRNYRHPPPYRLRRAH